MKKILLAGILSFFALAAGWVYAEQEGIGLNLQLKGFKPDEVFEKLRDWEKNFELPEIEEIREGRAVRSLVIAPTGNTKITDAEVVSVSGNNFTVKVWGLSLAVETNENTKFVVGRLRDWSLSELKVGDKVDIIGTIDEASGSIKADLVNARISVPRIQNEEVLRLRSIIENLIRQLQEALRKVGRQLPPGISPVPEVSPTPEISPTPEPEAED
ncbi:MAG: hypothetical protein AB1721_00945 [Patescibacteria group bacterium]